MSVIKKNLDCSSGGKLLLISSVNSTGAQTLHTCVASTGSGTWDDIYMYAMNRSTGNKNISIEFGDTTNYVTVTIPPKQPVSWIIPGQIGNNGLVVKGFASSGASIVVGGYIFEISS